MAMHIETEKSQHLLLSETVEEVRTGDALNDNFIAVRHAVFLIRSITQQSMFPIRRPGSK